MTFPDRKIQFASQEGVDQFRNVADEFMRTIFGLEPGTYLITDESRLADFSGRNGLSTAQVVYKIMQTYHLGLVPNNLLQLFRELSNRTVQ